MKVQLNRRLTLERLDEASDGAGGLVQEWRTCGILWAEIRAAGAGQDSGVETRAAQVALRITVRAAPPTSPARPTPGHRFREGVRIFQILAVSERDQAGRYLTCFAREEVAL